LGRSWPPPAALAASDADAAVNALWERYKQERIDLARAERAYDETVARLPWWAAPGPSQIDADGRHVGPLLPWPAIQDMAAPPRGAVRVIRPGPYDMRKSFELASWGDGKRARANYRRDLRAFVERRRAMKAEKAKVGYPAVLAELEQAGEAVCATVQAVSNPPASLASAALTVVLIVAEATGEDSVDILDERHGSLVVTLRALHPHLIGSLAADVGALLVDPERPVREVWPWLAGSAESA
jgi:hypothetical protein